jgi:hypothetical protein
VKWVLVGLIALCNALGDVLNSAGMKRHGQVEDFRPGAIRRLVAALVRNPYVVGGVAVSESVSAGNAGPEPPWSPSAWCFFRCNSSLLALF